MVGSIQYIVIDVLHLTKEFYHNNLNVILLLLMKSVSIALNIL